MKTWNIPAVEELNVKATAHGGAVTKYEVNWSQIKDDPDNTLTQNQVAPGGAIPLEGYKTQS